MSDHLDPTMNYTLDRAARQWVFADGTRVPVVSGGDGDEGDPAVAETPPEGEATPEAPAPGAEATSEAPAPAGAYTLPDDVEALDDDALRALHAELGERFDTLRAEGSQTLDSVEALRSFRTAQARIAEIVAARFAEDEAIRTGLDEVDSAEVVTLPEARTQADAGDGGETPEQRAASVRSVVSGNTGEQARRGVEEGAPVPVTRTASVAAAYDQWRPVREDVAAASGVGTSLAAMVEMTNLPQGSPIDTRRASVLAVARPEIADDLLLTDSQSHNDRLIEDAVADHRARRREAAEGIPGVRSAAICDPATIIRDAFVCGTDATPLRNAIVNMTANSGNKLKFQYRAPTSISAATSAVREWDTTAQAAISATDASTWKPCVAIACPTYNTESATEITACFSIDAFTELSSPEAEADFAQAMDRVWARYTEGWFLRKLDSYLHPWSVDFQGGTVPDIIEAILTTETYGAFAERLGDTYGDYVALFSPGVAAAAVIDENRRAYGDSNKSFADVISLIRGATGNDVVQLYDLPLSSANPGVIPSSPFPANPTAGGAATALAWGTPGNRMNSMSYTIRLIDPSAFVGWTTGEAVFGDQITLDQARQNKRGLFKREFGGMMKPGCAPGYKITISICPDGSRTGFLTPGCTGS